jgi:hypothetical protein
LLDIPVLDGCYDVEVSERAEVPARAAHAIDRDLPLRSDQPERVCTQRSLPHRRGSVTAQELEDLGKKERLELTRP